jgi:hypothetical protein
MLEPNFFDHTSVGLALAMLIALLVAGWLLMMTWKVTR